MAAQTTSIANIYEPAIWNKYFLEAGVEKNMLLQSGIAASTPEIASAVLTGGRTADMPFWDDLAHNTATETRSKVATDTDDSITPAGVTSDKDVAVKMFRTQSWSISPIVKYAAGDDPAKVVLDRYINWWNLEKQRLLLCILKGIFADATIATALSNDISGDVQTTDAGKLISSDAIMDTQFLLGDAFGKFTAMIMHSTVYKRLKKLDLVEDVPDSQQVGNLIGKYGNLDVIVDDGMTNTAGSTYKYHTFLFGRGAIAMENIPIESGDMNIELYRQPIKGTGFGQTDIITRMGMILHPRGIKYGGSLTVAGGPSDADLEADNWTKVYLTKNIRIARLITNG